MTTTPSTTTDTATTEEGERGKALRAAYGAATTALREKYRPDFDALYEQEAKARGVDYTRKPTAEEKAEAEMKALIQQFPHLAESLKDSGPKEFTTPTA